MSCFCLDFVVVVVFIVVVVVHVFDVVIVVVDLRDQHLKVGKYQ